MAIQLAAAHQAQIRPQIWGKNTLRAEPFLSLGESPLQVRDDLEEIVGLRITAGTEHAHEALGRLVR